MHQHQEYSLSLFEHYGRIRAVEFKRHSKWEYCFVVCHSPHLREDGVKCCFNLPSHITRLEQSRMLQFGDGLWVHVIGRKTRTGLIAVETMHGGELRGVKYSKEQLVTYFHRPLLAHDDFDLAMLQRMRFFN